MKISIPLACTHLKKTEYIRNIEESKKEGMDNELWISFKRDIAPWPPHCFSFFPPPSHLSLFLCVLCLLLNRYGLTVMGQWPVRIRLDCYRGAQCLPELSLEVITRSYLKPLFKAHPLSIELQYPPQIDLG